MEAGEVGKSKTNNFNYSNGLNCLEITFLSKCHERKTFGEKTRPTNELAKCEKIFTETTDENNSK